MNIETPSSDDVLCFVYNLSIHQLYNVRNICLYNVWLTVLLTQTYVTFADFGYPASKNFKIV